MSARSYMSIGDVLTLLRQEFPDVTISKIRFLESQGLVNPERTPSGYRKFYEHDVERLRWVLRQQREHFLPLKVIKDRLDDDPSESATAESSEEATPSPEQAGPSTAVEEYDEASAGERRAEAPVLVGHRVSTEDSAGRAESRGGDRPATMVGDGSTLPGIESSTGSPPASRGSQTAAVTGGSTTRAAASVGTSPPPPRGRASDPPGRSPGLELMEDGSASAQPVSSAAGEGPTSAAPTGAGSRRSRATPAGPAEPSPKGSKPRSSAGAEPASSGPATPSGANGAKEAPDPPPSKLPPNSDPIDLDGASLSVDELSAACGLDVTHLRELQEYGLLSSYSVAGVEYFDEEALEVANLAAQFARYGIEPRHLRLYKNAAEREAGFVEQIVLPLVRQRNPEARARAHETADELTRLGQQLRGSLLRNALGNLLNG